MGLSREELAGRLLHRRAFESVVWGMPAVNFELMYQAALQVKASWNQVVYWSRTLDWKNQTLTPNPDTIYLMPFYNTGNGPVVLEIPPATDDETITGSVDDAWQTAIEDVGPAGVDKGKGGKYLILPPGFKDKVPDGFIPMPSLTVAGFALLRSNLSSGSDADVAKAVAYGRKVRIYPLSQAASPPDTTFIDAIDSLFDSTIKYDIRYFRALDAFVQREPWLERDKAMIDSLASIGIVKGTPFKPDDKTKATLEDAAREARDWLDIEYEQVFLPPFNEGTHWALPASPAVAEAMQTQYADPNAYPLDGRGTTYSLAFFSAKHIGAGQYYLMTIVDNEGKPFDGSANYRLGVPPDAPVRLYWLATAYDRVTHALIRDQTRASRGSNSPDLQKNSDGSVDVWFGPEAPDGKKGNWVPTKAGGGFEVLFRLYGPEKPFFEKKWILPTS